MEDLTQHILNPNQKIINLINLDDEKIITSTSKWLSDRWFLHEVGFKKNLVCVEISPFNNTKDSNVFVGEKYLNHKIYKSPIDMPTSVDFLSIIDPDNAFEILQSIDFSRHSIKYFCISINPLKEKNFKENRHKIKNFMKDKAVFVKQNRTELLYSVI
jgi:hypothetical protein